MDSPESLVPSIKASRQQAIPTEQPKASHQRIRVQVARNYLIPSWEGSFKLTHLFTNLAHWEAIDHSRSPLTVNESANIPLINFIGWFLRFQLLRSQKLCPKNLPLVRIPLWFLLFLSDKLKKDRNAWPISREKSPSLTSWSNLNFKEVIPNTKQQSQPTKVLRVIARQSICLQDNLLELTTFFDKPKAF